jgi:hypothetical protein
MKGENFMVKILFLIILSGYNISFCQKSILNIELIVSSILPKIIVLEGGTCESTYEQPKKVGEFEYDRFYECYMNDDGYAGVILSIASPRSNKLTDGEHKQLYDENLLRLINIKKCSIFISQLVEGKASPSRAIVMNRLIRKVALYASNKEICD